MFTNKLSRNANEGWRKQFLFDCWHRRELVQDLAVDLPLDDCLLTYAENFGVPVLVVSSPGSREPACIVDKKPAAASRKVRDFAPQ